MKPITKTFFSATVMLALLSPLALAQQNVPAPSNATQAQTGLYTLDAFGDVKNANTATAAYQKALETINAKGGGMLVIPGSAPKGWSFFNASRNVTVVDTRGGTVKIYPPQTTGLQLDRTYLMPEGESAPHWNYNPMITMENATVRGSTSYLEWLQEDVKAGKDARFYMPTNRGLFPGMFLTAHGGPGYGGKADRLWVKSLGYDKAKKMDYFVADTEIDHKKGALVHNKTHVNAIRMTNESHTEAQSLDFENVRNHYSQGDSYLFDARFHYMGDVHSTVGDENGVLYAALVHGSTKIFSSKVASVNPQKDEVVFSGGDASTLGTGRPLINMNPQKWIIGGSVVIVRPGSWYETAADDPNLINPVYQGKSYPTALRKNAAAGRDEPAIGGLIRFSKDAPLTQDVVGRYFAVDDKSEMVSSTLRRWYLITSLKTNPDGTKDITIQRKWWGAKDAGAPTLYSEDNYTADGHEKPLKYVIAPGSLVYDVSGALGSGATRRTLLVAPYADRGSTFDFVQNDPIEQAIGADPALPIPMRAWTFDKIPSAFPSPIVDAANYGVTRSSIMHVKGRDKDGSPAFDSIIHIDRDTPLNNVLYLRNATVNGAALRIAPSNGPAPIVWSYGEGGKQEAKLNVDEATGDLTFNGGLYIPGGFTQVGGLSGTAIAANNLRGIDVAVPARSTTLAVKFPKAEADADYALFLETNWLTGRTVTAQTPEGFTLSFDTPAPDNAHLNWMMVR
jgi:hypothetical protein